MIRAGLSDRAVIRGLLLWTGSCFCFFGPQCFPYADKLTPCGSFFFFFLITDSQPAVWFNSHLKSSREEKAGQETRSTPHRRTDGGADERSIGDSSG